jgi:hypothetical protein
MSTVPEETPPKRRTLEKWMPDAGQKLRVFFPHGGPVKVLVATGEFRPRVAPGPEWYDYLMKDEAGRPEWVPGWYLAAEPAPAVV